MANDVWNLSAGNPSYRAVFAIAAACVYLVVHYIIFFVVIYSLNKDGVVERFKKHILNIWAPELSLSFLGVVWALLYAKYGIWSTVVPFALFFFIRAMLNRQIKDAKTIENYAHRLEEQYEATIRTMAMAVDKRDPFTAGHSRRVAGLTKVIAAEVGGFPDEKEVYFSGLLHDVGKISVPDSVLLKPGKLEDDEWAQMKMHPEIGHQMLLDAVASDTILHAVRSHHEWMIGRGYPDGLQGEQIPLIARIVSVADAFDAMVSNRIYRKGMPIAEAKRRLLEGGGTQFDRGVVDSFVAVLDRISKEELLELGYGDQPPNSDVEPLEEISLTNPRLDERLRHMEEMRLMSEGRLGEGPVFDQDSSENPTGVRRFLSGQGEAAATDE
ncbi:HD-GYP domain-containing protein [Ferroacidibacillus organovorans]|nr:HD-GYP domain-containing protein [Ferroacidibacillus organovorans]